LKWILFLLPLWAGAAGTALAADRWSLEGYLGNAYNFPSQLKITQDGGFSRSISADYDTNGFDPPLYYMVRGARWEQARAWELSLIHQKLYLQNPPAGVAALSVSHGFNILTVNRAFRSDNWIYRFGAGPVITHAEGIINGVSYSGSFQLSGVALLAGAGRRFYLGKSTFLSLEAAATAAWFDAGMSGPPNADIQGTNVAIHGLAGMGFEF
jgi:hypothetical protein